MFHPVEHDELGLSGHGMKMGTVIRPLGYRIGAGMESHAFSLPVFQMTRTPKSVVVFLNVWRVLFTFAFSKRKKRIDKDACKDIIRTTLRYRAMYKRCPVDDFMVDAVAQEASRAKWDEAAIEVIRGAIERWEAAA